VCVCACVGTWTFFGTEKHAKPYFLPNSRKMCSCGCSVSFSAASLSWDNFNICTHIQRSKPLKWEDAKLLAESLSEIDREPERKRIKSRITVHFTPRTVFFALHNQAVHGNRSLELTWSLDALRWSHLLTSHLARARVSVCKHLRWIWLMP